MPATVIVLDESFYKMNDQYYSQSVWWKFGEQLGIHFDTLTLFVPLSDRQPPRDASLVKTNNTIIEGHFHYGTIEEYYRKIWKRRGEFLASARKLFRIHDLIIIRLPCPATLSLARIASAMRKPIILFVAGNIITASRYRTKRGIKAVTARIVAKWLRHMELSAAKMSVMIGVWGEELLSVYDCFNSNVALAADPNISQTLMNNRRDTCESKPYFIIRVGSLIRIKGIDHLLIALAELRRRGRSIQLNLVGGTPDNDYLNYLKKIIHDHKISNYVHFHGRVSFDSSLFAIYRESDIHVISSTGEGLPRCIAEGRVFGLPTIATNVGGIPTVVEHRKNGLLIPPEDPQAIADAVEKVIDDDVLRKRIIRNGYKIAKFETSEFQAARLTHLISRALEGKNLGPVAENLHATH